MSNFQVPSGYDGADTNTQQQNSQAEYVDLNNDDVWSTFTDGTAWFKATEAPEGGWVGEITKFLGVMPDRFNQGKFKVEVEVLILNGQQKGESRKWSLGPKYLRSLMGMVNLSYPKDTKRFCVEACVGVRFLARPEPTNDGTNKQFSVGPLPDYGQKEEKAF